MNKNNAKCLCKFFPKNLLTFYANSAIIYTSQGDTPRNGEKKTMTGTEKQIKWAEDIKAEAYGTCDIWQRYAEAYERGEEIIMMGNGEALNPAWDNKVTTAAVAKVRAELDYIFNRLGDSAAAIIDKRHKLTSNIITGFIIKSANQ